MYSVNYDYNNDIVLSLERLNIICRTCLKENENLQPIANLIYVDSGDVSIINMLIELASIQANENDGKPNQICSKCFLKLFNAYTFKKELLNSEKILNDFLDQVCPTTKNEIENNEKIDPENVKLENDTSILQTDLNLDDGIDYFNSEEFRDINDENTINNFVKSICKPIHQIKVANGMVRRREKLNKKKLLKNKNRDNESPKTYSCPECDKIYVTPNGLKNHMVNHSGERPCLCSECGKSFRHPHDLRRHMLIHAEAPFQCKICTKRFRAKYRLINHEQTHSGQHFTCEVCREPFRKYGTLRKHVKRIHGKNYKPLICKECDKMFYDEFSLNKHMNTHTGELSHQCQHCGRKFTKLSNLRIHERVHSHDHERPYKCNKCTKAFAQLRNLRQHYLKHNLENNHLCQDCGETFSTAEDLRKHVREIHIPASSLSLKDRPFSCHICSRSFTHEFHLNEHMHTHEEEKIFSCEKCEIKFTRLSVLKAHQTTAHSNGPDGELAKMYKCHICSKLFRMPSLLKKHILIHTDVKPYKCDSCGKCFRQSGHLDIHRRLHTGERPYVCPTCGKGFRAGNKLSVHLRSHTGERPYKCLQCGHRCVTASTLKKHMEIHNREMQPHVCNVCNKEFLKASMLRKHKKDAHGTISTATGAKRGRKPLILNNNQPNIEELEQMVMSTSSIASLDATVGSTSDLKDHNNYITT